MERYAYSVAKRILERYNIPNDAYDDIMQSMFLKFYEKLQSYDPTESTPTTYFTCYFKETAYEYMSKEILHLKKHDIYCIAKIYAAVSKLENEGICWTYSMLVAETGLSEKKIRTAFLIAGGARYQQLEEALNSGTRSPEQILDQKEILLIIEGEIQQTLSKDEQKLLKMRFQENGNCSFKEMAETYQCTAYEIKKRFYRVMRKLRKNLKIQELKP